MKKSVQHDDILVKDLEKGIFFMLLKQLILLLSHSQNVLSQVLLKVPPTTMHATSSSLLYKTFQEIVRETWHGYSTIQNI